MAIKKLKRSHLYSIIIERLLIQFKKKQSQLGKTYSFKTLKEPDTAPNVLITYVSEVYDKKESDKWMEGHANRWQTKEITNLFLNKGFNVDIVDYRDLEFTPSKKYDVIFGHEPLYWELVQKYEFDVKIYYATTLPWMHLNNAIEKSVDELYARKNIKLNKPPTGTKHFSWNFSDHVFYFGNDHYLKTFKSFVEKSPQYHQIQNGIRNVSSPDEKDFSTISNNFLYLGSWGCVFRGLEKVLEVFAKNPDMNLYVCNDILYNTVFFWKFRKLLFNTPNIHTLGFVDTSSDYFKEIIAKVTWQIYPSSSEASASSVVLGMRNGLIPIISKECTVDTGGYGTIFPDNSIKTIATFAVEASKKSSEYCEDLSNKIIKYSQVNFNEKAFIDSFDNALNNVLY